MGKGGLLVLLLLSSACGRLAFDPLTAGDGNLPAADACTFGPFSAAVPLTTVSTSSEEWGPWISPDKLELIFASDRPTPGIFLLYRSRRASLAASFDPPTLVPVGSNGDDPFVSDDGLTLYFAQYFAPTSQDIYQATRASTVDEFANPVELGTLDTQFDDNGPTLSSDGLTIVFGSKRNQQGDDLFVARRSRKTDLFDPPALLPISTTGGDDNAPILFLNDTMLVFASDRLNPGSNDARLYQATWGPGGAGAPTELSPILHDPSGDEVDPTLSRDGTTIVFSSNRAGMGNYDLYMSERSCQ